MFQDSSTTTSSAEGIPSQEAREVLYHPYPVPTDSYEIRSVIESNLDIQGGVDCLRGTRVTVSGILEAIQNGRTIEEIIAGLKKYFGVSISKKELERAIQEYKIKMDTVKWFK